ncbi:MAG: hypothetical protein ACRDWD_15105 [Acidimicrobiia bacterium]
MTGTQRLRSILAGILVVIGAITLMLASTGWWLDRYVLDTERFTSTVDEVLDRGEVKLALSDEIVSQISRQTDTNLDIIKPFVASIVTEIVDSAPFRRVFNAAVSTAHRALVDGEEPEIVLNLQDTYDNIRNAIRVVSPRTARDLPASPEINIEVLDQSQLETIWDIIDTVENVILYLTLGAVVLIGGGIAVAPRRWRTLALAGWSTFGSFAILLIALAMARRIALGRIEDPTFRDAADAAWQVVTHGLIVQSVLLLIVAGFIALGAGWTGRHGGLVGARDVVVRGWTRMRQAIPKPAPRAPSPQPVPGAAGAPAPAHAATASGAHGTTEAVGAAAGAFMTRVRLPEPHENPRARHTWRAVGLVAAAVIALVFPHATVTILVVIAGLFALYLAIVEGFAAWASPPASASTAPAADTATS